MANFFTQHPTLVVRLGLFIGLMIVLTGIISALDYGDYQRISGHAEEPEEYIGTGLATMSNDGNIIVFESYATNPMDEYIISYFLHNRQANTLEKLNIEYVDGLYNQLRLSASGRYLLYSTGAFLRQVWRRDLETDTDEMVSVTPSDTEPNDESQVIDISADGRYAVFESRATDLVADMTSCDQLLLVRDMLNDTTICVPMGTEQSNVYIMGYDSAILSGDGSRLFYSVKNEYGGFDYELYVYDLATQTTTPIDVTFDDYPVSYSLSLDSVNHDGSLLVFTADYADNIVPGVVGSQVFYIYDSISTSITAWDAFEQGVFSPPPDDPTTYENYGVRSVAISDSGRYIWGRLLTYSPYWNLQSGVNSSDYSRMDTAMSAEEGDTVLHINFVYDRETDTTTQILVTENTTELGNPTGVLDASSDGKIILLSSEESTLVPDDTNGVTDIFLAFLQEDTPEPTVTELLVNGDFDDNDDADNLLPDGWKKVGLLKSDRVRRDTETKTYAHSTPNAFQLQGTPDEVGVVSKLTRNAKISGVTFAQGDTLTFSAMVDQRSGIPGTPFAKALVRFNNGTQQAMVLKLPNPKVSGYTSVSLSKTLKRGDVKSIRVDVFYGKSSGKLYLDDLRLTHTPAPALPMLIPVPAAPEN